MAGKRPVISTTPEQDASRKAQILAYVAANPEPDEKLVPKVYTYTEGKNKTLGSYYRFHELRTGFVEYVSYPGKDWNDPIYKQIYERYRGYKAYDRYELYTRPYDGLYNIVYAKYTPATNTEEGFIEFAAAQIDVRNLDRSENIDKRNVHFSKGPGCARIFLFKNDPMPYRDDGNKAFVNNNNTKYNEGFLYYFCNLFKYCGGNKLADIQVGKFFNIETARYWAAAEAYRNIKPQITSKFAKLEQNGLVVSFDRSRPELEKVFLCASDSKYDQIPTSYWFLEDAADGGRYLIHYTRSYNYKSKVREYLDANSPIYDDMSKDYVINIKDIFNDTLECLPMEKHPEYIHISPKREVSMMKWNGTANQYEACKLSRSRYYGYGLSMFFDVDKWKNDPLIGPSLDKDFKSYVKTTVIQNLVTNIRKPLLEAINNGSPEFYHWVFSMGSNAFLERMFGPLNWKSADYEKQLGFTKDELKFIGDCLMTKKNAGRWSYLSSTSNAIKIMVQLYTKDQLLQMKLDDFKDQYETFVNAVDSGVISTGWRATDRDGLVRFKNEVYTDFYARVKSGKLPADAWRDTSKKYNL